MENDGVEAIRNGNNFQKGRRNARRNGYGSSREGNQQGRG